MLKMLFCNESAAGDFSEASGSVLNGTRAAVQDGSGNGEKGLAW